MKRILKNLMCFGALLFTSATCYAQESPATEEHAILKKDVGRWKAVTTVWMNEVGETDPNAEPQSSEGIETNRMVGDLWVVSDFKGEFGGMPFSGHSVTGYSPEKKAYMGTWIDSFSIKPMKMVGTYDKSSDTMTFNTEGWGMDGKPYKGKIVAEYIDRSTRKMTMYDIKDGKEIKSMQIEYSRMKRGAGAKKKAEEAK